MFGIITCSHLTPYTHHDKSIDATKRQNGKMSKCQPKKRESKWLTLPPRILVLNVLSYSCKLVKFRQLMTLEKTTETRPAKPRSRFESQEHNRRYGQNSPFVMHSDFGTAAT